MGSESSGRATVSTARPEEDIARGQRVARYAKLDRFEPASVRRVRLTIEDAVAAPERVALRLYA